MSRQKLISVLLPRLRHVLTELPFRDLRKMISHFLREEGGQKVCASERKNREKMGESCEVRQNRQRARDLPF